MLDIPVVIILYGMFIFMMIGLASGHILAFVLGGVGIITGLLGWGPQIVNIGTIKLYDTMGNYGLVAIPMFVLMANFLTDSNVAEGLFSSIRYLFGGTPGGLGVAVILVATIFSCTTGIIGASVVTMGLLAIPVLMKYKYKDWLTVGMVGAGGSLGILTPPSIMLVMMASYANVSIGKMFLAVIGPSLLLSFAYMAFIFIACKIHPEWGPAMSAEELAEVPLRQRIIGSLVNLIPPLILIVGILGTIFTGIATPTEASGVGAFVALLMTIAYKRFSWQMVYKAILTTAKTSAMIFTIMFGANIFVATFVGLRGNKMIMEYVLSIGVGMYGTFALLLAITFFLGMFLDWIGVVLIVFPIFLPMMDHFGVDRLWMCTLVAVMLQTSFMSPPWGYALFYIRGIAPPSISMETIYWGVMPFVIIICLATVVCVSFPQLLLYLPSISGL